MVTEVCEARDSVFVVEVFCRRKNTKTLVVPLAGNIEFLLPALALQWIVAPDKERLVVVGRPGLRRRLHRGDFGSFQRRLSALAFSALA